MDESWQRKSWGVNTAVMQNAAMVQQQWQQQQQIQQSFGLFVHDYRCSTSATATATTTAAAVGDCGSIVACNMGAAAMPTTSPTQVTQQVTTEKKKGGKHVII